MWSRLSDEAKAGIIISSIIGLIVSILIGIGFASDLPWWTRYLHIGEPKPPAGVNGFSGGCDAFQVFAQDRWKPYGTVIRAQPNVLSRQVGGFAPNQSIAVDGWVHSRAAYPTNSAPWNSDVWFHLADQSGWASFAGVRAVPTTEDPSGLSGDGGRPAPTSAACQGSVN